MKQHIPCPLDGNVTLGFSYINNFGVEQHVPFSKRTKLTEEEKKTCHLVLSGEYKEPPDFCEKGEYDYCTCCANCCGCGG